jgi:Tfp pilus assembly protein PilO
MPQPLAKLFDLRINVATVLTLVTLIFGLGYQASKYETREQHDADIRQVEATYARDDITKMTTNELRDWLTRIEKKLDDDRRRRNN